MTRLEMIERSIRVSTVEQAMRLAEQRIRERRAAQHRFQASAPGLLFPMTRARSGSSRAA